MEVAEKLEASAVMINDYTTFRVDWMPFSGRKHSGYGIGGIGYTMRDMLEIHQNQAVLPLMVPIFANLNWIHYAHKSPLLTRMYAYLMQYLAIMCKGQWKWLQN
jgi:hypothetical protein